MIADVCQATSDVLASRSVVAPLLLVRSDGSLMSAEVARERPIETILSGPAASLTGAAHLTGTSDVVVADIGGTTTDVGIVRNGRPRVSDDGADIGGHRTMVEAVEVRTSGLGGDSQIELDVRSMPPTVTIGPRRVLPISVLAVDHPGMVKDAFSALQLPYRIGDLLFVSPTGGETSLDNARERALLKRLQETGSWVPVAEAASSSLDRRVLDGLLAKGLVELAGFTPTDASLVLGLHNEGDLDAANQAATILASASDPRGQPVRESGRALAEWVVEQVVYRSGEAVLRAAIEADGLPADTVDTPLVQETLRRASSADHTALPRPPSSIRPSLPSLGSAPVLAPTIRPPRR